MGETELRQHIDYLIKCTEELQLHKYHFNRYKACYEEIFDYCCNKDYDSFTFSSIEEYLDETCKERKQWASNLRKKTAYTVASYFESGEFNWNTIPRFQHFVSAENAEVLNNFKVKMLKRLSSSTVEAGIGIVRKFLHSYESSGDHNLKNLKNEDVLSFICQEVPYQKQCMARLFRSMRKFICFLRDEKIVDLTVDRLLTDVGRCRTKVLPCFSDDEILAIFSTIDRTTDQGRRDYAIFLLALRTGLRASDIAKLKLTDIDWEKQCITISQQKTKVALELPLTADVGNAIADYILNSRYESNNPYVFLRIKKYVCLDPLCPELFNALLQKYIRAAGIKKERLDGKSFHAFRRTAGTKMVGSNIPLTTVAQILGHGNVDSSKRYISLDIKKLMDCCLDLGSLHTRKEGLA